MFRENYYFITFIISALLTAVFSFVYVPPDHVDVLTSLSISLLWFVFFYLAPLWVSGYIVFRIRKSQKSHFLLEFAILFLAVTSGHFIMSLLFETLFNDATVPFADTLIIALYWAVIMYSLGRTYEYSKMLFASKIMIRNAKAEALRYQLNPHLLFNSINTISSLIHTSPQKADSILHDLAALLRFSLDLSNSEFVPVATELDLLKRYGNLEKARFGEHLTLAIKADPDCLNCLIPPLTIQPLVENAIKHNSKDAPLEIQVRVKQMGNTLQVVVSDNGRGFPETFLQQRKSKGIALDNISRQLAAIPHSSLDFMNNSPAQEGGARVVLSIAQ